MADAGMWIDEKTSAPANPGALVVQFHLDSKYMPADSQREGRPVFVSIERVTVWTDKDNNNIFDVDERHRRRWPAEYAAFKEGREQVQSGTPLMAMFAGQPEIVDMLRAEKVHTVEQLALVQDPNAFKFAFTLAEKARKFLGTQKANEVPQMQVQMEAMAQTIAQLQAQLAEQPRRGPGRPPKAQEIAA